MRWQGEVGYQVSETIDVYAVKAVRGGEMVAVIDGNQSVPAGTQVSIDGITYTSTECGEPFLTTRGRRRYVYLGVTKKKPGEIP
jgi:hypothetical protein